MGSLDVTDTAVDAVSGPSNTLALAPGSSSTSSYPVMARSPAGPRYDTRNVAGNEPGLNTRKASATPIAAPEVATQARDALEVPRRTVLAVDLFPWRVVTRSITTDSPALAPALEPVPALWSTDDVAEIIAE